MLKEKIHTIKNQLNLLRTFRLIWSVTSGRVVWTFLLIALESGLLFLSLYIFRLLVNALGQVNLPDKTEVVSRYLLVAAGTTVLYVIIRALTSFVAEMQAAKISEYIDDKIHASAVNLDLAFYESPAYFDTMKRAREAGPEKPNAILTNLVDISKNILILAVLGSVLMAVSWVLLPLLALFILPVLFVRLRFAGRMYQWRRSQTGLERHASYLSGLITGDQHAKEIKAFRLGSYFREKYLGIRLELLQQKMLLTRKSMITEIIATAVACVGLFTCIGFICMSTIRGTTGVGDVTLFLIVFPHLFQVLYAVSRGISALYQNQIFVNNLFELFDLRSTMPEPEQPEKIPEDASAGLSLRSVSFSYPHSTEDVLHDIDLEIQPGKIVALVGMNGAGKTTLIKLLSRLYDPNSGVITLGGINIKKFNTSDYRKQVSVVFQDFGRYQLSAADNIRIGHIEAEMTMERVSAAAMKSGAHGFIKKFPEAYATILGRTFENGREISIGQWQKLAIARAFYGGSRFIIFDEATSALDARSELELFESLREHIGHRGILIISHRLSAVKHADHIYVMSEGRIKQQGTHEELVASGGAYASLFTKKTAVAT